MAASASDAIKATPADARSIGAPQLIALIVLDQRFADIGLGDLATAGGGKAVCRCCCAGRIWASFRRPRVRRAEDVSGPEQEPHAVCRRPSNGDIVILAGQSIPTRVEIAERRCSRLVDMPKSCASRGRLVGVSGGLSRARTTAARGLDR